MSDDRHGTVLACFSLALSASFSGLPQARRDWSEQDLATAAALRDRALSGTGAFDHVSSLVTEVGPRFAGSPGDAAAVRWAMNTPRHTRLFARALARTCWCRAGFAARLRSRSRAARPAPFVATALGRQHRHERRRHRGTVSCEVATLDALSALPATSVSRARSSSSTSAWSERAMPPAMATTVKNRAQGPSVAGQLGAARAGHPLRRHIATNVSRTRAHSPTASMRHAFPLSRSPIPTRTCWRGRSRATKSLRLRLKSTARELPAAWSANVIGEIPGRDRANEIVLLGAHLDSWDITPGALDDGAGVAIVIEAARLIGRLERKPSRTVRVVLFANEEFGLSGATGICTLESPRSCHATSSRWKRISAPARSGESSRRWRRKRSARSTACAMS